jgi:hypothetical protein
MLTNRWILTYLLVIALLLVTATHANANSWPPMAVILLDWPLVLSLFSYGIGLIMIIFVEGLTLAKRLKLPLIKSLYLTTFANLFSIISGFVFVLCIIVFHALGSMSDDRGLFGAIAIGICLGLGFLSSRFWQRVGFKSLQLNFVVWAVVWFVISLIENFLLDFFNIIHHAGGQFPDPNVSFLMNLLQLLVVIAYFSVAFLLSVISEGVCLGMLLPDVGNGLLKTLLIMNVRSYAYVAFPLTILGIILRGQGWRF